MRRPGIRYGELVYFIQATTGGPVKIGYTAQNPFSRLHSLNTGHWETFRLLGVMRGGREVERALHQYFASLRIRREWFMPSDELMAHIAEHAVDVDKAQGSIGILYELDKQPRGSLSQKSSHT